MPRKVGVGETVIEKIHPIKMNVAQNVLCHFYIPSAMKFGFFYSFNADITGAARLYRAAPV
jgi:hypothetical protein